MGTAHHERTDKQPTHASLRVVLSYARRHGWTLLVGGILSLATSVTGLALPLVVRALIDGLGENRAVTGLLLIMTALVIANAVIGAIGDYVLERTGESVVLAVRRTLLSRLVRLRLSVSNHTEPGDLTSRMTADTTLVREIATRTTVSAVTSVLTLLATLALMAVVDAVLLGVTVFVLVLAAAVIGLVVPKINRAARQAQDAVGTMGAALERMFGAFRTIKASGAEQLEEQRVQDAAESAWRAGVRAAKWSALAGSTAGLAIQISFLAVLTVGGARVASGIIDVGSLIAFLLYVFYLIPPISALTSAATDYQTGAAALARILEAQQLPVEPASDSTDERVPGSDGPMAVTFEQVSFRYGPELPDVHVGVTFAIPPGGMTAIVGPSGAGKTTVLSLLERFYEPHSGCVAVDGVDVGRWPLTELRAAIGYVEQDAPVLSGSLRENLRFAMPDAGDDALHGAVTRARLDGLVARLPAGLDTLVGHRGTRLSGGERQRVAIARALLRSPRLLLLDEATSQLDAINEAALRDTIADIAATTTVLVVTHRLSTVTMADRIIVMDAGRVQAVGNHTDLVASNPLYHELATTQLLATAD